MFLLRLSPRQKFLLGFLACAGSMAFALYLQYFRNLDPCALCVLQRIAMIAAGFFFLLGGLHGPQSWGRYVYAGLAFIGAATGSAIAGRHVWLQSLPPDQVPACGPPLEHLLKVLPLKEALEFVLKGEGNCAVINAQWLGITLPGWTLIGFVFIAGWAVFCALKPRAI